MSEHHSISTNIVRGHAGTESSRTTATQQRLSNNKARSDYETFIALSLLLPFHPQQDTTVVAACTDQNRL
jgi:hypothetical protein